MKNHPLCPHCRDEIDCLCDSTCDDVGSCVHGCRLSKYTRPEDSGSPSNGGEVRMLLLRALSLIQEKNESSGRLSGDRDRLEVHANMDLDKEQFNKGLQVLESILPPDVFKAFQLLQTNYKGHFSSFGNIVVGRNRTEDAKHSWQEIRILLPTDIPNED